MTLILSRFAKIEVERITDNSLTGVETMLKKKIIYLAGLAMVAAGLGVATTNQPVEAAVTNPIRQGKKLNLTRSLMFITNMVLR